MEEKREQTAIDFSVVERDAQDFQQPITLEQIQAVCRRAFGEDAQLRSVLEVGDGQFNSTFLVRLVDREPVILRVAPSPERCILWHEKWLMRRELVMQNLLSPLASLLPTVLTADLTHSTIERDYLFLNYVPGVLWSKVEKELSVQEHDLLWSDFGRLVRTISGIEGETFGVIGSGPRYSKWSLAILDWLRRTANDAQHLHMDATHLHTLLAMVQERLHLLDEISTPRLLHGDLWTFNLLIERKETGPRILAILDADRGSWGDPLADWTFFLLAQRASAREQTLFWEQYGLPEHSPASQFRAHVYRGLHNGKILSVARRDRNERAVGKAYQSLSSVVTALESLIEGEKM